MEIIQQNYKPATKEKHEYFYTASDFLRNLQENNKFLKLNPVNIGKILSKLGFKKDFKYNGKYPGKRVLYKFDKFRNLSY